MSGSAWGFVWLAVALKIPIFALLWLVWWAIKDPPVAEAEDGGGGSSDRGPHAAPAPSAPARVRVARRRTPRRVR